jgi:hypothetical protein
MPNSNDEHAQSNQKTLFDPNKAFLQLTIVHITISAILLITVASIAAILSHDPRPFVFSSAGFNEAAAYLKVPLGLLTVSIPLLALLAANHRSEQTKQQMTLTRTQIARTDKQIQLTSGQNNFSNFYKHIEVFEKFCAEHLKNKSISLINPRKTHNYLFPNSRNGDFKANEWAVKELHKASIDYFKAAEGLNNKGTKARSIFDLFQIDQTLCAIFGLNRSKQDPGPDFKYIEHFHEYTYAIPGSTYKGFFKHLLESFDAVDELLKFDTTYSTGHDVAVALQLDLGSWMNDDVLGPMLFDIRACYPTVQGIIEVIEEDEAKAVSRKTN